MASRTVMILSVLVILVGYSVYKEHVPEGSSDPLKLKFLLAFNRGLENVLQLLDHYGMIEYLHAKRVFVKLGAAMLNTATDGIEIEDSMVGGIPIRIYRPSGMDDDTLGPAMVYYHGGGWTICNIDTHDAVTAYFAKHANMVVISVEYRLNPEYSQMDGLDDCVEVTKYVLTNGEKFGVDTNRVVVAGDSAGGNYAAAVPLKLRDESFQPLPKIQMLIYPAVQGIDLRLPSYQQNKDGPMLTSHDMFWFKSNVCYGDARGMSHFKEHHHVPDAVLESLAKDLLNHDQIPNSNKYPPYKPHLYDTGASSKVWDGLKDKFLSPYYNPLMAEDHSGLPQAYIFTGQHDLIRDEGYLYAGVLRKAGVDVTHYNCLVGWHGMINMVKVTKDTRDVMDHMCSYLKQKL